MAAVGAVVAGLGDEESAVEAEEVAEAAAVEGGVADLLCLFPPKPQLAVDLVSVRHWILFFEAVRL